MNDNTNDEDEGYALCFSFPDQSPSFTYGFEAGMLFQRMTQEDQVIDKGFDDDFPVREENLEMYQRMAAYKGYQIEIREATDGWVPIRFTKVTKPKPVLELVKNNDS